MRLFRDRTEAGRQLAARLAPLAEDHPVVLGLPRGGVPVAYEVARALGAPLDVIVVRKLGVPFQPELGMGAVGEDGVRVLNEDVLQIARCRSGRACSSGGTRAGRGRSAGATLPWRPSANRRHGSDGDRGRRRHRDRRYRSCRAASGPRARREARGARGARSPRPTPSRNSARTPTRSCAWRARLRSSRSASGTETSPRSRTSASIALLAEAATPAADVDDRRAASATHPHIRTTRTSTSGWVRRHSPAISPSPPMPRVSSCSRTAAAAAATAPGTSSSPAR